VRDREHDRWIPWYCDDTPGWAALSLAARGAMEGIARKINPKTGRLYLRQGLGSLSVLLHRPWAELEPALNELLAAGKVLWNGSQFYLEDPDYEERRRPSSAERVARHRSKKAAEAPPASGTDPIEEEKRTEENRGNVTGVTPVTSNACNASNVTSVTVTDPPEWWDGVIGLIAGNVGVELHAKEAWYRYDGHRANKGVSPNQRDAMYWLNTVMVREAKEAIHKAAVDAERTAIIARGRRPTEPPERPKMTEAQSRAFTEGLKERLLAKQAADAQRAGRTGT
jgi:hypothetical protein